MQFQIKCVKGQNKKHQPIRFNVELKVASIDETKNQQQKTYFLLIYKVHGLVKKVC